MRILSLCLLFLLALGAWAEEIQLPPLSGPVVDEAGLLSEGENTELSNLIRKIDEQNGPQIQILIVRNLQGQTIEDFSIYVAETWGIGSKENDNGIIITVAMEERKTRIEVGQGIEDTLTDYTSSELINDYLVPNFKEGRYFLGFRTVVEEIAHRFEIHLENDQGAAYQPVKLKKNQPIKTTFILPLLLIFIFIYPIFSGRGRFARGFMSAIFFILLSFVILPVITTLMVGIFAFIGFMVGLIGPSNFLMSMLYHRPSTNWSSGRSGWGGRSGGSWGGGGGGFSGGGASGDW